MHRCVYPGLNKYHLPDHLVKVYVEVEWQKLGQTHVPQDGDGVAENKNQYHHRIKVQAASWKMINLKEKCSNLCLIENSFSKFESRKGPFLWFVVAGSGFLSYCNTQITKIVQVSIFVMVEIKVLQCKLELQAHFHKSILPILYIK